MATWRISLMWLGFCVGFFGVIQFSGLSQLRRLNCCYLNQFCCFK